MFSKNWFWRIVYYPDQCFYSYIYFYRLYDREGNGYITTGTLKEILAALDDKLTGQELDGIIQEIDTDGSGTVDFDGMFQGTTAIYYYIYMTRTQSSIL